MLKDEDEELHIISEWSQEWLEMRPEKEDPYCITRFTLIMLDVLITTLSIIALCVGGITLSKFCMIIGTTIFLSTIGFLCLFKK